jgi:hypothetical protein
MTGRPSWYSVRSVFAHDGGVFEERVTLWRATSFDEALELAEAEAIEYADTEFAEFAGILQAYEIGEQPTHGTEIFSLQRDSDLDLDAYIERFFDTGEERQDPS